MISITINTSEVFCEEFLVVVDELAVVVTRIALLIRAKILSLSLITF